MNTWIKAFFDLALLDQANRQRDSLSNHQEMLFWPFKSEQWSPKRLSHVQKRVWSKSFALSGTEQQPSRFERAGHRAIERLVLVESDKTRLRNETPLFVE